MLTTQRSALVAERPKAMPAVPPMNMNVCKGDELVLYHRESLKKVGTVTIGNIYLIGDFHWSITNLDGTQVTTTKNKIRCSKHLKLLVPTPHLTSVRKDKITIRIFAFIERGYALERVGYVKYKKPALAKALGL